MNALLVFLVLLQSAPSSDDRASEFVDLRGDSMAGRVLDADGKPVAGAVVRMDLADPSNPFDGVFSFGESVLREMRTTKLPRGQSGDDGRFHVQLTHDQRRLGLVAGFRLALLIEKEGFRPWRGYVGTCPGRVGFVEAKLERSAPPEFLEGRLVAPEGHEGPLSGAIAVTWDFACQPAFGSVPGEHMCEVAADGTFRVPRLPPSGPQNRWFMRTPAGTRGIHLRPAVPGFEGTLEWFAADTPRFELRLRKLAATGVQLPIACEGAGKEPAALTVLYRATSGAVWTCERPFGPVPQAGTATIAGIEAAGFCGVAAAPLGIAAAGTQRLTPLPRAPVQLRVRGEEAVPVAGADVDVFGVRDSVVVPMPIPRPDRKPLFRGTTDRQGTVSLPPEVFRTAACIQIRAEGHVPVSLDLAAIARSPEVVLIPQPIGRVRVTVLDERGQPLEGASLIFDDHAHCGSSLRGAPPRTDANGTFRGTVSEGPHRVLIYQPQFALSLQSIVVAPASDAVLEVRLAPGCPGFVRAAGARGQPMDWQGIRAFVAGDPNDRTVAAFRSLPASVTDQHGRARVDGLPAGKPISLQMLGSEEVVVVREADVLELKSDRAALAELRIRIPPWIKGPTVEVGRDGKTSSVPVTNLGAGDLVVFLPGGGTADLVVTGAGLTRREAKGVEVAEGKTTLIDLRK